MSVFGNSDLFREFQTQEDQCDSASATSEDSDNESKYQQECQDLRLENEELKRTLRILTRPNGIKIKDSSLDGPVAHVILFNNLIARKFRDEIREFFSDISNRKLGKDDYEAVSDPQPSFMQYLPPSAEGAQKKSSRNTSAAAKAYQAFSSLQMYKKFFLDHLGEPLILQDPSLSEWTYPEYEQVISDPLDGDPDSPQVLKRKRLQRICFNCGKEDHQMKNCDKSWDHRAVSQRRQKFMEEVAKYQEGSPQIRLGGPRYHAEEGGNENGEVRFSSYKPGVISDKLQEALGITENDIPPYIYQMRRLGYPPGHLANAKINNSGLSLYHEQKSWNGRENENEYVPVDVDKIIGYPGFNMPPLPGQSDEFKENNALPIDDRQSKTVMVSYFEHRNSLHKLKQEEKEKEKTEKKIVQTDDIDIEEVDMEMADDDEDVKEVTEVLQKEEVVETVVIDDELEDGEVSDDIASLTEDELKMKREELLKELKDSDYRHIKASDQDYRLDQVIDLTGTNSDPEEPPLSYNDTDNRFEEVVESVVIADDPSPKAEIGELPVKEEIVEVRIAERTSSSDTDYRMEGIFPVLSESPQKKGGENEKEESSTLNTDVDLRIPSEIDDGEAPAKSVDSPIVPPTSEEGTSEQKLPERAKFAKDITQFDAYYTESKSQGVYKKLRTLLKDSPRRQEK